eukprot:1193638-Prorocentrum_minimum.AAC.8
MKDRLPSGGKTETRATFSSVWGGMGAMCYGVRRTNCNLPYSPSTSQAIVPLHSKPLWPPPPKALSPL